MDGGVEVTREEGGVFASQVGTDITEHEALLAPAFE